MVLYLFTYQNWAIFKCRCLKKIQHHAELIWDDIQPVISMGNPMGFPSFPGTQAVVIFAEQKHRLAPHGGGSGTH